jgi:hypothetical protein
MWTTPREIVAAATVDGRAQIRLDEREFIVERYTDVGRAASTGTTCPIELIGVSLAA